MILQTPFESAASMMARCENAFVSGDGDFRLHDGSPFDPKRGAFHGRGRADVLCAGQNSLQCPGIAGKDEIVS